MAPTPGPRPTPRGLALQGSTVIFTFDTYLVLNTDYPEAENYTGDISTPGSKRRTNSLFWKGRPALP